MWIHFRKIDQTNLGGIVLFGFTASSATFLVQLFKIIAMLAIDRFGPEQKILT